MKKEIMEHKHPHENSFGTASVILSIFSILFSSPPIYGVILGIVALIFSSKQSKVEKNKWSKWGKALAIIGIILSVIFFALFTWLARNPQWLNQLLIQNVPA